MRIVILGCLLLAIPGCTVQAPPPPPDAWNPAAAPPPPPPSPEDQPHSPADRTGVLKKELERRRSAADGPAVRVGSVILTPKKTKSVNPVYPPEAITQRVQGVVILEVFIGVDGKITEARVLRSIPLLDKAAVDAVLQWEYAPTQLNGVTIPVITTVTVVFNLGPPPAAAPGASARVPIPGLRHRRRRLGCR